MNRDKINIFFLCFRSLILPNTYVHTYGPHTPPCVSMGSGLCGCTHFPIASWRWHVANMAYVWRVNLTGSSRSLLSDALVRMMWSHPSITIWWSMTVPGTKARSGETIGYGRAVTALVWIGAISTLELNLTIMDYRVWSRDIRLCASVSINRTRIQANLNAQKFQ